MTKTPESVNWRDGLVNTQRKPFAVKQKTDSAVEDKRHRNKK